MDYLPPVTIRVGSEFDPKGLAEADAALDAFQRKQTSSFGDSGKASGKAYGDALPGGAQPGLDRLEKLVRDAGKKDGTGWIDEFKKAAVRRDQDTLTVLSRGLEPAFERAGKDGSATLFRELSKSLGSGGMDSGVGRQLVDAFGQVGKTGGLAAGGTFKGGFLSGLGDIALAASPVLAPVAAVLISEMFADIGGATVGAVGLGGLITGSIVQLKTNPEVKAAATNFGRWLSGEFVGDTSAFAAPLEDAFGILKTDLKGPLQDLRTDFTYLAPYVRDFAMYLGAAAEKFMPGFNRAIQSSGPILTELGHGMTHVADGLNVFFDEISKGGKGEVEALDIIFRVLGGTLAGLGFLIRGAADGFDKYVQVARVAVDWTDKILGGWTLAGPILSKTGFKEWIDGVARSFDNGGPAVAKWRDAVSGAGADANLTADDMKKLSSQISATTVTADTLAGQMADKLFNSMMSTDQASLHWHESLTSLGETLAKNGLGIDRHTHSLNLNTKAGQENDSAILGAVQSNMQAYQAWIAAGGSAKDAAAKYDANTTALEKQMRQAGYTQSEVDGLIGKYKSVPDTINTSIALEGLQKAIDGLTDLMARINNITTPRTEYIDVVSRINTNFGHLAMGGVVGEYAGVVGAIRAASGLNSGVLPPRNPGTLVLAGEPGTRGEVFAPLAGISKARAMALAGVIGNAYGFGVVSHTGPSPAALSALSSPDGVGGGLRGGGGTQTIELVVHNHNTTTLDGKVVHQSLIRHAQRHKIRTGTTGLA